MRDPRQTEADRLPEAAAMVAAYFAAAMPLAVWLRHVTVGLSHLTRQYPDAVGWGLAYFAAFAVMPIMHRVMRRLPAEDEADRHGGRRRLTKQLAAALAVGYATLTYTGGLVAVFAIDTSLAGQRLSPAYAYVLAASVSVGVAVLVGVRSFRRFRKIAREVA